MQRSQNLPLERLRGKNKAQNKQKYNFFSECAKRREKETQILTTHKIFMKTHIVNKQNIIYDLISVENDF